MSTLCVNTGDYNYIIASPEWKDHPHYIIAQEDLPDFDDLTPVDHPHFALLLLTSIAKDLEKKKTLELQGLRPLPIKGSLHELCGKAKISMKPKFENVAPIQHLIQGRL
jgi:hypothetical protein